MVRFNVPISSILGLNYYVYELVASDYNPHIDDNITITCTVKTVFGNTVSGKSVTLYQNGEGVSSATTNSSGVATWTVQCDEWGIQDFNVEEAHCSVDVDGWKYLNNSSSSTWSVLRNKNFAKLVFNGYHTASDVTTSWQTINGLGSNLPNIPPVGYVSAIGFVDTTIFYVRINTNGVVKIRCGSGTILKSKDFYLDMTWVIGE